jgi:Tfp pilus assembly protein PilE
MPITDDKDIKKQEQLIGIVVIIAIVGVLLYVAWRSFRKK